VLEPEPGTRKLMLGGIMGDRLQPDRYTVNGGPAVEAINGHVEVQLATGVDEIVIAR
jgi:hypothetical protein